VREMAMLAAIIISAIAAVTAWAYGA
jgi:hypothetical protein